MGAQRGPTLSPVSIDGDASEDGDDETGGPNVEGYPREPVAAAIKVAIDGFEASTEEEVLRLLREVRNRLEVLSRDRLVAALGDDDQEVADELDAVFAWFHEHGDLLTPDDS